MLRVYNKRRSEYRLREQLPNGQEVNLYFYRLRAPYIEDADPEISYQWFVGFYIGSRKEANRWFKHNQKNKPKNIVTGNGTLTAMKWAMDHILDFAGKMDRNEELVIGWEEVRRKKAYQFLRRYGFTDYYDELGNPTHLGIRNKEYWYLVKEE
ncbi:hypothetical protein [Halobacillus litoralis]|uniref:N-acetyltransferase domain-containing protein n=1 Tax=Halobacillus litoralis TaxID=45668 RepID=A0A410MCD5_9BACI|nr:hypothetical protein [Halobacillus litoralis]QAS52391.1 hypothetical protein HLI_09170 [Halobacillus litoralis]